jgi:hypothetical protein
MRNFLAAESQPYVCGSSLVDTVETGRPGERPQKVVKEFAYFSPLVVAIGELPP